MDIPTTLKAILVNDLFINLPQSVIGLDDGLRDKLGLDSLGFSELRAQCEYTFGVKIEDEDFNPTNFASIRALTNLLSKSLADKQE